MRGAINGTILNLSDINSDGATVILIGASALTQASAGVSSAGVAAIGAASTRTLDAAQLLALPLFFPGLAPADFTNARNGDPATTSTAATTLVTDDPDFGACVEITNFTTIGASFGPKALLPVRPDARYRIRATFKIMASDGTVGLGCIAAGMRGDFSNHATTFGTAGNFSGSAVQTVEVVVAESASSGVLAWPAASQYLRPMLRLNTTEVGLVLRVGLIEVIVEAGTPEFGFARNTGASTPTEAGDSLLADGVSAVGGDSALAMSEIGLGTASTAAIAAAVNQVLESMGLESDAEIEALRASLTLTLAAQTLASAGSVAIAGDSSLAENGDSMVSAGAAAVGADLAQALDDELLQSKFSAMLQGIVQGAGLTKRPASSNLTLQGIVQGAGLTKWPASSNLTPRAPGVNILAD